MNPAWLAAAPAWLVAYELVLARYRPGRSQWPAWRRACGWCVAPALGLAWCLGPLGLDHRLLWAETLQFCVLAFAVGPLTVLAAPVALARGKRPGRAMPGTSPPARAWRRRAQRAAALAGFVLVTIAWRLPVAVDVLRDHHDLVALEAVTLVAGSWWFWEAIGATPARPLVAARPARLAMAAAGVWSVWIFAYAVGFSSHPFYPSYRTGSNPVTAQEWAVCVLWLTSAAAVLPQVFTNLVRWLAADRLIGEAEVALYLKGRPDGSPPDGVAPTPRRAGPRHVTSVPFWQVHGPHGSGGAEPWTN